MLPILSCLSFFTLLGGGKFFQMEIYHHQKKNKFNIKQYLNLLVYIKRHPNGPCFFIDFLANISAVYSTKHNTALYFTALNRGPPLGLLILRQSYLHIFFFKLQIAFSGSD